MSEIQGWINLYKPKKVIIFSRDEVKQYDMQSEFQNFKSFIQYVIGDVRDYNRLSNCMLGADYIMHAAALKQVPSCDFYPLEATKTNVLGTENVLNVAIQNKVKKVICLSTDKAVYPINSMGVSKALMERLAIAKARYKTNTVICIVVSR